MHPKRFLATLWLLAAGLCGLMVPAPAGALMRPHPRLAHLTADGVYSSPHLPEPVLGQPDDAVWIAASKQIFAYVRNDNVNGFVRLVSRQGLWISGLTAHSGGLHVTPTELSQDLHRRGPLYHAIFLDHRGGNFVVSPDDQGQMQELLLK